MNKEENYKSRKFRKKIKRVTSFLGWILFAILIIIATFLLFVLIANKIAEKRNEKPIVGLYTIISPSMTGSIDVYDVVFVLRVPTKMIHRGDVITFRAENVIFGDTPVTHRVIEKYTDDQGKAVYVTKGDYNQYKDDFYAYERNVIGKVLFKIPQLGRIQFFLVGRRGWFIVVLLPALAIIATDIFKIIKIVAFKDNSNQNNEHPNEESNEQADEEPNEQPEINEKIITEEELNLKEEQEILEELNKIKKLQREESEVESTLKPPEKTRVKKTTTTTRKPTASTKNTTSTKASRTTTRTTTATGSTAATRTKK